MLYSVLDELNEDQKEAVLHEGGPAMVLAGAGSGKTRVLVSRAVYLMSQKQVNPESILLVTFTNKAAEEMNDRVKNMTSSALQFSGTFHRLCAKILRKDGYLIDIPPSYTILDDDDQLDIVKDILKTMGLSVKEFNPRIILSMISQAKSELLDPEDYKAFAKGKYQETAAKIYTQYESVLKKSNAVDFDNLLNKTLELFLENKQVLEKYQRLFEHVLVDEYQDVNKAQYELTKLLAFPQNNLFSVGDFSQSIYRWRGADYRNMLMLKKDYPNIKEYRLEQNYRSTQTVLDIASAVISHNTSHPILELWTDNTHDQKALLYEAESEIGEAEYVIKEIQKLSHEMPLSDIAVLYRTNAQSRLFEDFCIRFGIHYRLVGGVRFYARKEIKDVLSYMRLFLNPDDKAASIRAEKIGKRKYLSFLVWRENNHDKYIKPIDIFDEVMKQTQYREKYDEDIDEDRERLENIQELRSVSSLFNTLEELLENVALVENSTIAEEEKDKNVPSVSLMSLHAAKGLEFRAVFLVGMEEGLFPHSRALMDKDEMEEERRLCYVGVTRAKQHLYLTYTRKRLLYGTITGSVASRFISEIPNSLFTRLGVFNKPHVPAYTRTGVSETKPIRRLVPIDDGTLDDVLSGNMDIEAFLDL